MHYGIGRHLEPHDPGREAHLGQAMELFSRLGAGWDLAQAREAVSRDLYYNKPE